MVNRGFSRGCDRCRQQHTKCDETRPECLRCTKRGVPCSGYRSDGNVLFQFQDVEAIQTRPKRKRRKPGDIKKADSAKPRLVLHINSTTVDSSAYSVIFAHGYFGKESSTNKALHATLGHWADAESELLAMSTEALVLLYMAGTTRSEHVANRARAKHAAAVSALRAEVSRSKTDTAAILGSAELLLCCEAYSLVSSFDHDPDVMSKHLFGMTGALMSKPLSLTAISLQPFLIRQLRHAMLTQSLLCRKKITSEKVWRTCSRAPLPVRLETLVQIAWQLAGLLAASDRVKVAERKQEPGGAKGECERVDSTR